MFPITVINLAAGVTDIYHLSSQYPWFRIVPKNYLDFVQFPGVRWKAGDAEKGRFGKNNLQTKYLFSDANCLSAYPQEFWSFLH